MSIEEANIQIERQEYPNFWNVNTNIDFLIKTYGDIDNGVRLYETDFSILGRVMQKRSSSKKLIFYTLRIESKDFQIISDLNSYENQEEFSKIHSNIKTGDIIGVKGYIGKGNRGELSIFPRKIQLLSACHHDLPSTYYGLEDKELRYSNRYLDLIVNKEVGDIFIKRHKIIKFLREYFYKNDFMEVETPILSNQAGGANAKPFITHMNSLKQNMFMRIAPELYLKQLVIGGFNKVFEIGKQFRNEDIDTTHNPEFTSCEAYQVGADYNMLIKMTEDILYNMAIEINGSSKVKWLNTDIDFQPPYQIYDVMDTLITEIKKKHHKEKLIYPHKELDIDYNEVLDKIYNNDESVVNKLMDIIKYFEIDFKPPHTLNRVIDCLIGEFVEPLCIQPTFLINHPQIMSPLAKPHRSMKGKTERFELFVNKKELCNAYTELNNPFIQKKIFMEVAKQKAKGDDEIPPSDENFVKALEYGLPPTGGWGLGIDRLIMILTGQDSIREVIFFPPRINKN